MSCKNVMPWASFWATVQPIMIRHLGTKALQILPFEADAPVQYIIYSILGEVYPGPLWKLLTGLLTWLRLDEFKWTAQHFESHLVAMTQLYGGSVGQFVICKDLFNDVTDQF